MENSKVIMRVHFIGIGGIGVSALARYYLEKGWEVSGSDLVSSEITQALKKRGAKIFIGPHNSQWVDSEVEEVIYSPAIPKDNPELKKAKRLKIKCQSYPQALGELTKKYFTIAVSGTHGKSTTTAMISLILVKAGFDPTVILGTKLREFGNSNCRVGESKYLVIEADEYQNSFLNYWPKIIVLTNLEPDHLDYFKNFKNYVFAFKKFVSHLPKKGTLVLNKDDKTLYTLFSTIVENRVYFSLKQREAKRVQKILKIPGKFNISNALAALTVARSLKIPDKISFQALSEYKGAWRRFEEKMISFGKKNIKIVSDYAHHPTEIKATLEAAREKYPKKKIWCLYQPHQYQRTYHLFDDFVEAFWKVPLDKLIITKIYEVAGREEKEIKKRVNSKKLVKIIKKKLAKRKFPNGLSPENVVYLASFEEIINYLKKNLRGKEVVIIMGAGDIYNLVGYLTKKEKKEKIN